eukprot:9503970-Pyramimonas_sp.AAC.1
MAPQQRNTPIAKALARGSWKPRKRSKQDAQRPLSEDDTLATSATMRDDSTQLLDGEEVEVVESAEESRGEPSGIDWGTSAREEGVASEGNADADSDEAEGSDAPTEQPFPQHADDEDQTLEESARTAQEEAAREAEERDAEEAAVQESLRDAEKQSELAAEEQRQLETALAASQRTAGRRGPPSPTDDAQPPAWQEPSMGSKDCYRDGRPQPSTPPAGNQRLGLSQEALARFDKNGNESQVFSISSESERLGLSQEASQLAAQPLLTASDLQTPPPLLPAQPPAAAQRGRVAGEQEATSLIILVFVAFLVSRSFIPLPSSSSSSHVLSSPTPGSPIRFLMIFP